MNAEHQKQRRLRGKSGAMGQVDWNKDYARRLAAHPERAAQTELRRRSKGVKR